MTIGQWIKSLFFKKKAEKPVTVETKIEPILDDPFETVDWDKLETNVSNETSTSTDESNERMFDGKIKRNVVIDGVEYQLTEKQMIFYNAIVKYQEQYPTGVLGWKIAYEFIKAKHNLSEQELKQLPKWKFTLSAHNKTMKYLISSGLVVKNNKFYKAKV